MPEPGRALDPGEPLDDHYDVIVVGAGPAGAETARQLALRGHRVCILEEHGGVGEPVQCAGLIATNVFALIDLEPLGPFHQQAIQGGHIVAPDGSRIHVKAPQVHAHAVDRAAFDRALIERAVAAGATLATGATYLGSTLAPAGRTVRVRRRSPRTVPLTARPESAHVGDPGAAREETAQCTMLVGADGVASEVARTCGFAPPEHVLSGLEIELEGLDIPDPENVHVHTGSHIAPGYFAWVVPKGRHGARIGLCVDVQRSRGKSAWDYYHDYIKLPDVARLVEGGHETKRIVGCIPLGLRRRLSGDAVALVGDAGGFAKPTSGGGIYMASWGAQHLARVVDRALRRTTKDGSLACSQARIASYDRRIHGSIGRELAIGSALHQVFRKMSDDELNALVARLDDRRVIATINRHGDIDHPSRLILPVLARRPSLVRYAGPAARELLFGTIERTLDAMRPARVRQRARARARAQATAA